MTVNTADITSGPYLGNGSTSQFSYDFRVDDKSQLTVYETTDLGVVTTLTVDVDYTVNNVGTDGGGTIDRIAGALPTDYTWYIRSNYLHTQGIDFASQGGFFPDIHETAIDKLTFLSQQQEDLISRSVRLSDSYSGNADPTLPNPVADKTLVWSADGLSLINGPDQATFISYADAAAASAAAALVSEGLADADSVQTGLDRVATGNDLTATNADVVTTNNNVVTTNNNVTATNNDVLYSAEWAVKIEDSLISVAAGGNGTTDYSSLHWAAKAAADVVLTNADVVTTNANVVLTNADVVSVEGIYDLFDDRMLGAKAADPTLDNDGNSLVTGAMFFHTGDGMKVWDGAAWQLTAASVVETITQEIVYTATASQTIFSGPDDNAVTLLMDATGAVLVYLNGVKLIPVTDYTVNTGVNSVTISAGATAGDILSVTTFNYLANTALSSQAEAEAGTDNATVMTPLRTKQSIASEVGVTISDQAHNHTGVYEPADATILKDADIGVNVQSYDADLATLATQGFGTGAFQVVQLNGLSQLPAVDGGLLTGFTASQVGLANASLAYGAVGSIGMFVCSSILGAGATIAGSSLLEAGIVSAASPFLDDYSGISYTSGSTAPSGTWRHLGYNNSPLTVTIGIFLRIS